MGGARVEHGLPGRVGSRVGNWRDFGYEYAGRAVTVDIAIHNGELLVTVAHLDTGYSVPPEQDGWYFVSPFYDIRDYQFSLLRAYARNGITCTPVRVLLLPVILVLGFLTAVLWYRDRRPPKGHCQSCGYDLAGNVSGACPECGVSVRTRER